MRVLVFGGAGKVGSILCPSLERVCDLRIFDLQAVPGWEERCIVADVNDDDTLHAALQDVDAVIYLAMGTGLVKNGVHSIDAAFDVNVKGAYRVMQASLDAGVRRFVHASSMSIYREPFRFPLDESSPPDGWSNYSVTKQLGETVCEAAAMRQPDATIVVLRLVFPLGEEELGDPRYPVFTGPHDLRRLVHAALTYTRPGLHVFQASSLDSEDLPNARVTEALGWRPEGR